MSTPHLPPIAQQLWWVVPKQLAGVRKPTLAELAELRAEGIEALVSLLSDDSNLNLYAQQNIPHIWVPIIGGTAPSLDQLAQIKTFVDNQHRLGTAVAIHCSSGRRRTGTVLAALLIAQRTSYENAIDTILQANPEIELREPQINFLKSLSG
ncbi:dual specificity protein phosphatase [Leptolyngbya sp. Heron Island J]|uniref:protein-tyrosine phosphatase family protein n=1 Tax=Leptolyngbya sp. Heron Island J TaxID=1385935 RepID=UPI0003B9C6AA|nr:dual specificity protein phosphatase family protein [Leptolyngbya sp. Heron Island J]ESA36437.1 dual specificity protein phosphatase [Leptolyngbya sp. Heron Island J]